MPYVTHHMAELPEGTNFYGSIETRLQPADVARFYAPPVWRVRKCSWTDFEARSDFAEVIIESGDPVLVHGPVANVTLNCSRVVEPLVAAGLSGAFECYDEADALVLQERFGDPGGGG